jgi:hypothetical protein
MRQATLLVQGVYSKLRGCTSCFEKIGAASLRDVHAYTGRSKKIHACARLQTPIGSPDEFVLQHIPRLAFRSSERLMFALVVDTLEVVSRGQDR